MKMIIFNCPAYKGLTRDIPDWLDNTNCGHYAGQVPCQDYTDCLLKQIVNILRENTCKPEECGMNKPDWNGEVYGCNAGFDDNVSGCSCALANNLLRKLDIEECE